MVVVLAIVAVTFVIAAPWSGGRAVKALGSSAAKANQGACHGCIESTRKEQSRITPGRAAKNGFPPPVSGCRAARCALSVASWLDGGRCDWWTAMVLGVDRLAWGALDHSDLGREERPHDRPTDDLRECCASEAREHSGALSGCFLRSIHRAAAGRGRRGARL